ncbi:cAMP-dependent protein kinase regulatory subunit [Pseudoscourfieldia marina]
MASNLGGRPPSPSPPPPQINTNNKKISADVSRYLQTLVYPRESEIFNLWRGIARASRSGARRFAFLLKQPAHLRPESQVSALVAYIKSIGFSGLKGAEEWRIREVCKCLSLHFYEKGHVVFRRGDAGRRVFIVVDGIAGVYADAQEFKPSKRGKHVRQKQKQQQYELGKTPAQIKLEQKLKGNDDGATYTPTSVNEGTFGQDIYQNNAENGSVSSPSPETSPESSPPQTAIKAVVYRDAEQRYKALGVCLARRARGHSFGELAVMRNVARAATVVAEEALIMFSLDGDDWMKLLMEPFDFERRRKLDALCRCAAFRHYGLPKLHAVADYLSPHEFAFQQPLIRQGERPTHVHIITRGVAEMIKTYNDPLDIADAAAHHRLAHGNEHAPLAGTDAWQTPAPSRPGVPADLAVTPSPAAARESPLARAIKLMNVAPRSGQWRLKLGVVRQGDVVGQHACIRKSMQWCDVVAKDMDGCSTYAFYFLDFFDRLGADVRFDLDRDAVDGPIEDLINDALQRMEQWILTKRVVVEGSLAVKPPRGRTVSRTSDIFDRNRNDVRLYGPPARTIETAARPIPTKTLVPPQVKVHGGAKTPWRRAQGWNMNPHARSQSTSPGPVRRGGGGGSFGEKWTLPSPSPAPSAAASSEKSKSPSSRKKKQPRALSRLELDEKLDAEERFAKERAALARFQDKVGPFRSPALATAAGTPNQGKTQGKTPNTSSALKASASEPELRSMPKMTQMAQSAISFADEEVARTAGIQLPGQLDLAPHIKRPSNTVVQTDYCDTAAVLTLSFEGKERCLMEDGPAVESAVAVFYVAATTCDMAMACTFCRWSASKSALIWRDPRNVVEATRQLVDLCIDVTIALKAEKGLLDPTSMTIGNGTRMRFGLEVGKELFLERQGGVQFVRGIEGKAWDHANVYCSDTIDEERTFQPGLGQRNAKGRWRQTEQYTKSAAAAKGWLVRTSVALADAITPLGYTFVQDGSASVLVGGKRTIGVWVDRPQVGGDASYVGANRLVIANGDGPLSLASGSNQAFKIALRRRLDREKMKRQEKGNLEAKKAQKESTETTENHEAERAKTPARRTKSPLEAPGTADPSRRLPSAKAGSAVSRVLSRRKAKVEGQEQKADKPLTPGQIRPETPSANLKAMRKWQRRASMAVLGFELYHKIHPNEKMDEFDHDEDEDDDHADDADDTNLHHHQSGNSQILQLGV